MKSWGVYISGKITGDPDYKQKFKRVEEAVARYQGIPVIYPRLEDDPWFKEERLRMQTENMENGWTGLKCYGDINSSAVIRISSGEEEGGGDE